jgi:hypothetical protein
MIEKKSFIFFLALTAFILIVGFLQANGSFNLLKLKKETSPSPTPEITCGGFAGKKCPTGYTCQVPAIYPDAQGTCTKTDEKSKAYTCPESGWVGCMPTPDRGISWECTDEFDAWAKTNCPNYQGRAL